MTNLPPIFGFEPWTPIRVQRIRAERDAMFRALETLSIKPKREAKPKSASASPRRPPKQPTLHPDLPPELAQLLLSAAKRV